MGEDQFIRYAKPMIEHPGVLLIYDRSWYSEFVYGPIMRQGSELTEEHCRALEALAFMQGGGHILYLTAPIDTLWKRCKERGETYITGRDQLLAIKERYAIVMKECPRLPVFEVNTGR